MTCSMLDSDGTEKEPKQRAFSVVWAIGKFYFFFVMFFYTNTHFIIIIYLIHDMERVGQRW